jgi:hypothetical protein
LNTCRRFRHSRFRLAAAGLAYRVVAVKPQRLLKQEFGHLPEEFR